MKIRLLQALTMLLLICGATAAQSKVVEREVSFKTEDGWSIYGNLHLPEGVAGKVPAVIFLHSYEHDQDAYGQYLYPGLAQIIGSRKVATLRFDFRGRGKSTGAKHMHMFSPDELAALSLDVRAALDFLASQPQVDRSRIGIVAEGKSAEAAVMALRGGDRVLAMEFISGRLSEEAKSVMAANAHVPLYLVVSKEDRESFQDMADLYKLTESDESHISVFEQMGMGTTMFSVWRSAHPKEPPIEEGLAEWMVNRFISKGDSREVSFKTEDGWTLYGTLRMPGDQSPETPRPGVVLVHTAFTDRYIFDHLAEEMVGHGLVVLNFDTRGRGKSTEKGELLDLSAEERNRTNLDSRAAVAFLASQPGIGRIGLLGTDRGANYALGAAIGDSRVGAVVLMTTLINDKEKEEIAKMDIPLFFLASTDIEAIAKGSMAAAYRLAKNRGSRLVIYKGGSLGYEIFELDETLEPVLAEWMKDQLSR